MKKFLPVLFLLSIFACQSDSDEPLFIIDIPNEFNISMKEILNGDDEKRSFAFGIETIEAIACSQAEIITDLQTTSEKFSIQIKGIYKPDDCDNVLVKLKKEVALPSLQNGAHNIQLVLQDAIFNNGQILVEEDKYSIVMQDKFGIEIAHEELYKIPENTIWGYLAANKPANGLNEALSNQLNKAGVQNINLPSGNYYYFSSYANASIDFEVNSNYENKYRFIYSFDGEDNQLKDAIRFLQASFPEIERDIKIYTSKGTVIE